MAKTKKPKIDKIVQIIVGKNKTYNENGCYEDKVILGLSESGKTYTLFNGSWHLHCDSPLVK